MVTKKEVSFADAKAYLASCSWHRRTYRDGAFSIAWMEGDAIVAAGEFPNRVGQPTPVGQVIVYECDQWLATIFDGAAALALSELGA